MLELDPIKSLRWIDYEKQPGVRFEIRPLSSRAHKDLRDASTEKGKFDEVTFASKAAKKIINDWEGVGKVERDAQGKALKDENGKPIGKPVDCNDVEKLKFGTRYAYTVMPWLIEQAMDFDQERDAAVEDAKND